MNNQLLRKCALLIVIGIMLFIPLTMIEKTIEERTRHRAEAIQAIAASSAGEQTIIGPILSIPVLEEYDEQIVNTDPITLTGKTSIVRKKKTHVITVFPRELKLNGKLKVEKRAYGLHETSVFDLRSTISGDFEKPLNENLPSSGTNSKYTWGAPSLSVGLGDVRGITGAPQIEVDEGEIIAAGGVKVGGIGNGFHADFKTPVDGREGKISFKIALDLAGTGKFGFVPVGGYTTAKIESDWPHPSFGGDFLPRARNITENGFEAEWSTTALASSSQDNLSQASGFQVRLIDPVDVYRQGLRAVKYGILFIVLGFAAFFTFENLKNLPIHPIQYLLVGLAQAIFFLLLTSLSEHITFWMAYLISSAASVALIGIYLTSILHSIKRSIGFSFSLGILYGALYGILCSEQNALLLGSLLLFVALAGLMVSTRNIDWYQIGKKAHTIPLDN